MEHRKNELTNCSFVKTVLMLLVVLYHSCVFWTGTWFTTYPAVSAPGLAWFAKYLNSFHIYGFALVSGYIFCYQKLEQGKYDCFLPFAANKAKRLLVPYVFTAIVWVIPVSAYFSGWNGKEIVNKYLLAAAPNQLWFLVMLFVVFMGAYVLSNLFAKENIGGFLICLGFYGVGIFGGMLFPNFFQIWTACKYMVFFLLGFKQRKKGANMLSKIPAIVWVLVHVCLFALSELLMAMDGKLFLLMHLAINLAANVTGALMAFFVLQKIASLISVKQNRIYRLLEQNAMVVYLLHQQIVYFVICLLNEVIAPGIHVVVNFAIALGLSLIVGTVLRKFRTTRFLIGEK